MASHIRTLLPQAARLAVAIVLAAGSQAAFGISSAYPASPSASANAVIVWDQ